MLPYTRSLAIACFLLVSTAISGCGPKSWFSRTESFSFSAQKIDQLRIETHNGLISATGRDGVQEIQVTATLKGGGNGEASARACLDAIELVSVSDGERRHKLTWRWKTPKHKDWQNKVAFEIVLPGRIEVEAETHNGAIAIHKTAAPCRLVTHNGSVEVLEATAEINAQTHNGGITATGQSEAVTLITHNGEIQFRTRGSQAIGGRIATHNGSVNVELGRDTSTELSCKTHNGRVTCAAALQSANVTKRQTTGVIGSGGAALVVETANGSIDVTQASDG